MHNKRVLILGAHTDDFEFGCGGYIQRFKNKKVIVFSPALKSIPDGFGNDCTENELKESCNLIGCEYELLKIPVRNFGEYRQQILEKLIEIKNEYNPEIVFTHSSTDTHQDHRVIHNESIRAFRDCTIYGYNIDCNNYTDIFTTFVELKKSEFENKKKFISCYKSQIAKKNYIKMVNIINQYWGLMIGKNYAETYETIRAIQ